MNYGQLKQAIANRLSRTNLTDVIPDFVALGESRLYYGFRDVDVLVDPLRINAMIAVESASLTSLPAGYLEAISLTVPDSYGPRALEFKTPQEFAGLATASTYPRYFTIKDGSISVQGGAPTTFTFSYYKKFDALAADSDTNWLLTNSPNVYLYSALIEAYAHTKDDARIVTAVRMFAAAANALTEADKASRHSGSRLTIPGAHR